MTSKTHPTATITTPNSTSGQSGRFGSEQVAAFRRNRWPFSSECAGVTAVDFIFPDLPSEFDGYSILHLSDLHIGKSDDLLMVIGEKLSMLSPDLVVVTGDFQTFGNPPGKKAAEIVTHLVSNISSNDGWIAVLGNHDTHDMLDALEAVDVRVLANESVVISRGDDALRFVGTDDVHAFYSPDAVTALEDHQEGFRIALIHTVDLATVASRLGYNLYLSGHTHGGQICLPGGRPVLTALDTHRHLASGRWRLNGMQGYTSRGLGYGLSPPLRFNCPGEATVVRLVKGCDPN
jgi:hypothetical protein